MKFAGDWLDEANADIGLKAIGGLGPFFLAPDQRVKMSAAMNHLTRKPGFGLIPIFPLVRSRFGESYVSAFSQDGD